MKYARTAFFLLLAFVLAAPQAEAAGYSSGGSEELEVQAPAHYGNTPDEYRPYGRMVEPYKEFFKEEVGYHGPGRDIPEPTDIESVKIGFLGPIMETVSVATGGASHAEEPLGIKMLQGAQLAIREANEQGGYRNSLPYELIVRNDNGLWGASGNEIIRFAYIDEVRAIFGTIDGANSHIAIRVALKAEIPVMNSADTDPTFVETNIPWVFSCITDDRQMCYVLADFAFKKLGLKRVAALRAGNRYGRMSIAEFRDGARRLGHPLVVEMQYPVGSEDFEIQLNRIQALNPDGVITYGNSYESALICKALRERGMNIPYFGSDRMVTQEFIDIVGPDHGPVYAGFPFDPRPHNQAYTAFKEKFRAAYREEAEQYAAHAYDGMWMLIKAIEKAGLNRALIRDALAEYKTYEGITGTMTFDPIYNNISPAVLAALENGEWRYYTRDELEIPDLDKVSLSD